MVFGPFRARVCVFVYHSQGVALGFACWCPFWGGKQWRIRPEGALTNQPGATPPGINTPSNRRAL